MAKKKITSIEELDQVLEEKQGEQEVVVKAAPKAKDKNLVNITLRVPVWINGVRYFGNCKNIDEDTANQLAYMAQEKTKADIRAFAPGNNYLVERALDNTLIVKQVKG